MGGFTYIMQIYWTNITDFVTNQYRIGKRIIFIYIFEKNKYDKISGVWKHPGLSSLYG